MALVTPTIQTEQDLALLNEENAIRVTINGSTEKFFSKDWIEGTKARGSNSMLSKAILGTAEGFSECRNLEVQEEFVAVLDMLILWLSLGDEYLKSSLTDENASDLFGLAQYLGITKLEEAVTTEQKRRDEEEEAKKKEAERRKAQAAAARQVKCVICGHATTPPRWYKGDRPACWACRVLSGEDSDVSDDVSVLSFGGYDEGYDYWSSDDSWNVN